ncbi:type 1 glutamine amidotransferase domain-containing protein [Halobacillus sp. BBL2006]|uniref:type 1 glutamine amidotransferase domain-containing protein n=1 Tax=Halobacillus sp. BBL2006 TaxID=1543706 RepID=UPI000543BEC1|nr:type 1 glutamine amidotransferase domain-containing protein [Halobacillus sp. BBL2006]KHE68011.1 thiamine biosynthesis protein ThiJ [Halobacillus sp. BBL2006]
MTKKILMVVTNTEKLEDHDTGLWLSEFVEPATEFKEAGFEVVAASMNGGRIPIDPNSYSNELPRVWDGVMEPIHDTPRLSEINPADFDGIFLCGGHGTMVDFPENDTLEEILKHFISEDKLISSVCHGPSGFVGVKDHNDQPFVKGRKMTGFTNEEEKQTGLEKVVPFSLEDRLREEGAVFETGETFKDHVIVDRNFVTGQNPQSSLSTAQAVIKQFKTAKPSW